MRYGLFFDRFRDSINMMYVLGAGNLTVNTSRRTFEIELDDDIFVFSVELDKLVGCDKVIKITHSFDTIEYGSNNIFVFPGEPVQTQIQDEHLREFLETNLVLQGGTIGFEHENYICNFGFNLHALYHSLGYEFLNLYPQSDDKEHLLGLYYSPTHISGRKLKIRDRAFDIVTDVLGDKVHVYERKKSKFSDVIASYNYMGAWENIHISSYTDYATSVCNLIYETNGVTEDGVPQREHMTEKTMKALLFSKINMFTIWLGSVKQYKYLVDNGFWMLNFEFIDEEVDLLKSVELTARYLAQLHNELGSNKAVYKFLVEKYGDKLIQNTTNLQALLEHCPEEITNNVLRFIRGNNE